MPRKQCVNTGQELEVLQVWHLGVWIRLFTLDVEEKSTLLDAVFFPLLWQCRNCRDRNNVTGYLEGQLCELEHVNSALGSDLISSSMST